jgi:hypothetical protein
MQRRRFVRIPSKQPPARLLRQSSDGNLRPNRFDRVRPDYARIEIAVLHCLILDVNLNIRDSRRAKRIG